MGFTIFVVVLLLLVIVTLLAGVKSVPQGYEWTQERFGKFQRTLKPGLNLIIPYIDRIGRKMNMMEQVLDVPSQEVITKDNALVTVDAVVFYQVLDAATAPWGIKAPRIEVKDIRPPADLVASMARQMKAEREKRANILDAEGFRQAAILKAEGEKQAEILSAEGRRQAAFLEAEARERSAQAEAEATRMVSNAIAAGNVQAINYFVAQRYVDALKEIASAPNQKTLILPIEATAMLGSLQGIAEVAREAFGSGNARTAAPAMSGSPIPVGTRRG